MCSAQTDVRYNHFLCERTRTTSHMFYVEDLLHTLERFMMSWSRGQSIIAMCLVLALKHCSPAKAELLGTYVKNRCLYVVLYNTPVNLIPSNKLNPWQALRVSNGGTSGSVPVSFVPVVRRHNAYSYFSVLTDVHASSPWICLRRLQGGFDGAGGCEVAKWDGTVM